MKKKLLFVAGMVTLVGNIYSTKALALTPISETVLAVKEKWREAWSECTGVENEEMCKMNAARQLYESDPAFMKISHYGNSAAVITEVDIEKQKIKMILSGEQLGDIPSRRQNSYPDFTNFSVAGPANQGKLYWKYYTDGREANSQNGIFYDWEKGDVTLDFGHEIEIDASGTELLGGNNEIYTLFRDSEQYLYYDIFNYSDCVNSPEFSERMICRGYLEERLGEIIYLPAEREEEVEPEIPVVPEVVTEGVEAETLVVSDVGSEDNSQEIKNETFSGDRAKSNVSVEEKAVGESAPTEKPREEGASSNEYVSLPLTRGEGCYETIKFEFLWWLIALILAGDALIMWWFWPEKSKNGR